MTAAAGCACENHVVIKRRVPVNFGMRFVLFCFLAGVLVAAGCSGSVDSQSDAGQDDGGEVVPDGDPSPEEPANPDDDGDGEYDDGRDAVDGGDLDGDQPSDGPPAPSCTDNLWNQGEQWVDCGGACAPCTTQETTVTIQASGTENSGTFAHMLVEVNGRSIGDSYVTSSSATYSFTAPMLASAVSAVTLTLDNAPTHDGSGDARGLLVHRLRRVAQ